MPTATDVFAKVRGHERSEQLRAAREADLLPYFRRLEGPAGPVVEMEGAERIMLGSNNYLGLTADPRVRQAARDALDKYGTGLTGSRLLNGTLDLHLDLERELAEWMGTEEAIVFSTGHQANVGTLGTILAPGDTVAASHALFSNDKKVIFLFGSFFGGPIDRSVNIPAPTQKGAKPIS